MDAVPGRINDSISFIQRPGIFYGQCSELCGVGHGFMPIVVEALPIPNFMAWAEQQPVTVEAEHISRAVAWAKEHDSSFAKKPRPKAEEEEDY